MDNLVDNISGKVAFYICESKDMLSDEFQILKYGVFAFLQTSIAIISTIIFGLLTSTVVEMTIISITGALIKRNAGGVHCSSPRRCVITGIILSYIFTLIGINLVNFDIKIYYIISTWVFIHSFIIFYKKCPVPSKNKPLKKEETRRKLKKNVLCIHFACVIIFIISILLNTYINPIVLCVILGIYMQALSLTSIGSNLILYIDKVLLKLKI